MKRDKKRTCKNRIFPLKVFVCTLAMAFGLAGCGVFGGGKAEVKVDFGQYGDTGNGSPATGADTGNGSAVTGADTGNETDGSQTGGETDKPRESESATGDEDNGGQSGSAGSPGKDDDTDDGRTETQSEPESTDTAVGETSANSGGPEIEAPKEHREAFNKSEFAAELLDYLASNGRGEEAFSEPIFDSEKKIYSQEELEKLSDVMCKIFRNEIYARHGMIFGDEDLNQLYGAFSWYEGTIGLREFEAQAELPFNKTEYANISNVAAVEKARQGQSGN